MIYDQNSRASSYMGLHPWLDQALQDIEALSKLQQMRQGACLPISGQSAPALELKTPNNFGVGNSLRRMQIEFNPVPAAEKGFEVHRFHLDIHVVTSGEEYVQVAAHNTFAQAEGEYDSANDISFWHEPLGVVQELYLRPGYFLLLFPWEGHKVGVYSPRQGEAQSIAKFVYKLRWPQED